MNNEGVEQEPATGGREMSGTEFHLFFDTLKNESIVTMVVQRVSRQEVKVG